MSKRTSPGCFWPRPSFICGTPSHLCLQHPCSVVEDFGKGRVVETDGLLQEVDCSKVEGVSFLVFPLLGRCYEGVTERTKATKGINTAYKRRNFPAEVEFPRLLLFTSSGWKHCFFDFPPRRIVYWKKINIPRVCQFPPGFQSSQAFPMAEMHFPHF